MNKSIIIYALAAFLFISSVSNVFAITGRLGNSRMVLNLNEGESAERYVLVQNYNDVLVTVELGVSGDLADNVKLNEREFVLQPGEEKKAYFTITAEKAGTTETKINVKFTPAKGSGVGLSSTIIVITSGDGANLEDTGEILFEDQTDETVNSTDTTTQQTAQINKFSKISSAHMLIISTVVLIMIFIVLIVYAKNKSMKNKRSRRPHG